MRRYLARVMHPEWYHGQRRKPPYFEGWYFKLVSAGGGQRTAIIPGLFKSDDPKQDHSFVQILDGVTGQVVYHRFPADAFHAAPDRFEVAVGASRFTDRYVALQLGGPEQTLYGEVHFEGVTPWPVRLVSPGIMGPFGWLEKMECNHGVLSLDHKLRGTFVIDGRVVDWTGGRGYTEKDWGAAFPSVWVWMQSNHFETPGTCLTASIATIPVGPFWFRGTIVGLWHAERLYRFATYNGACVEHLAVKEDSVKYALRARGHRLEIHASRDRATTHSGLLRGPSTQAMGVRVPESLSATIEVRLSRLGGPQPAVLLEDTGRYAGMEAVGDLERLVGSERWRVRSEA